MQTSFLDSLLSDLKKTEFGAELRQLADELVAFVNDLSAPDSPRTTNRPPAPDKNREESKSWTMNEFRLHLHQVLRHDSQFSSLPDSIDLSGFAQALTRLSQQARDGTEYGRIAYMRTRDGVFEMGKTCRGNQERVAIECRVTSSLVPAIMIHTHPPISGNALSPCHFSPQDFLSFLDITSLRASIVIAPRASLMMIKTDRMPSPEKIPDDFFESIFDRVSNDFRVPHQSKQARATQIICSELGLELYLRKQDAPNFVFEQIRLKANR